MRPTPTSSSSRSSMPGFLSLTPRSRRGAGRAFTLLELIVAIVILGILAALLVVTYQRVISRSHDEVALQEVRALHRAAGALVAFETQANLYDRAILAEAAQDYTGDEDHSEERDRLAPLPAGEASQAHGWVSVDVSGDGTEVALAMKSRSGNCARVWGERGTEVAAEIDRSGDPCLADYTTNPGVGGSGGSGGDGSGGDGGSGGGSGGGDGVDDGGGPTGVPTMALAADGIVPSTARMDHAGRYTVFTKYGPGGTAEFSEIRVFRYDRVTDTTSEVSTTQAGVSADGQALNPTISADGRYVAFLSFASNLGGPAGGLWVKDMDTGTLEHASIAPDGTPLPTSGTSVQEGVLSSDGRYVTFLFDTGADLDDPDRTRLYQRDLQTDTTIELSTGFNIAHSLHSSADGRYVFVVTPSHWSDTGGPWPIVRFDRQSGTSEVVVDAVTQTILLAGTDTFVSADGRYVAFGANDASLPGTGNHSYLRDIVSGTTTVLTNPGGTPLASAGSATVAWMSANGRYVVHVVMGADSPVITGTGTGVVDLVLHDTQAGTYEYITSPGAHTVGSNLAVYVQMSQGLAWASSTDYNPSMTGFDLLIRGR